MLKCRKKLAEYDENFFLTYILITGGMRAIGMGGFDLVLPSAIAFFCLGLKLFVTDYSKKELFWMVLFGGLVLLNFCISREKTLLLTMISVYGTKNVDINKVFAWSLWSRIVLFGSKILLVFLGIVEGGYAEGLTKYSVFKGKFESYRIPCLGFSHPNYAYLSIVMIAFLVILVYQERIKWYAYLGVSAILLFFYKILLCRTGWYVWVITLALITFYFVADKLNLKELYMRLLCLVPIIAAVFSLWMVLWASRENELINQINGWFSGRFHWASVQAFPALFTLFGHEVRSANEILYIQFPYNYGWVLYIFFIILYVKTMMMLANNKKDYYVIVFAAVSIYFLGEAVPLSAGWNESLLLISGLLFKNSGKSYVSERITD